MLLEKIPFRYFCTYGSEIYNNDIILNYADIYPKLRNSICVILAVQHAIAQLFLTVLMTC
jgi:hypothetical protein